jgi:cytochrome o ubiquinol oxidase operon protein cyoD
MSETSAVIASYETDHPTLRLYVVGFILSLLFTLTAYSLVYTHVHSSHETFSHDFLRLATDTLALAQFFAQIYFFLHLGRETRPRWKLLVLVLMIFIVLVLVFGSLWIMYHLNYRMTPQQMNNYMLNQNGGI